MAERTRHGPRSGSRRVESWIYEAINVVDEALPGEISLLERGNVTWRYVTRDLQFIRPIPEYLTPSGRIILRDLQRVERDARQPFDRHDTLVGELTDAAAKAYDSLLEGKEGDVFRERVRTCLDEFRASLPKAELLPRPIDPKRDYRILYPVGPEEEFPQLVAQHIVNAIDKLPSHYTDATFWDRFGQEFLKLRSGPAFERLHKLAASLLKHDRDLLAWLDKKRGALVDRYDVPAAPMTGAVSEDR